MLVICDIKLDFHNFYFSKNLSGVLLVNMPKCYFNIKNIHDIISPRALFTQLNNAFLKTTKALALGKQNISRIE